MERKSARLISERTWMSVCGNSSQSGLRGWPAGFLLILSFSLIGCSDSTVGSVAGNVLIDGQPPKRGAIAFFSTDGKSRQVGCDILDGKYTAQVPVGISRVEISVSKITGQKKIYDTPDSPVQDIMEEVLPPKYNEASELTVDVKSGKNDVNFDLKTK